MKTAPMAATFDTKLTIVAGLLEEKGLETQHGKVKCLGETECFQRRKQVPKLPTRNTRGRGTEVKRRVKYSQKMFLSSFFCFCMAACRTLASDTCQCHAG
jgi:hypothetical protein